jgi:release factor glutamine methyltransferase
MTDIEYIKKYIEPSKLEEGLRRLEKGEPVQYIVGNVDFYGYNFIVNKNVLIPRFETEELIEKTIQYTKKYLDKELDIADLGTGSGCIAITLKKELNCNIDAVDISLDALEVARKNAIKNDVKINFYQGNMLEPLNKKYDIIISNPPYISKNEEIMDIVKNNEPSIALYAIDNGLYFYKEIIKNSKNYLKNKNILAFEIGQTQGKIIIEKDIMKNNRFLFIINS